MEGYLFLNTFLLFMLLLITIFTFFLRRVLKLMDTSYPARYRPVRESFYKNNIRSRKDFYQELTTAHKPFNWRIASALSIAQLSKKDINRFLVALDKVLKAEKSAIRKFDAVNKTKLELDIKPFLKKNTISEIEQTITNFESYLLLEDADSKEALEYLINLEVSNFSNEYYRNQDINDNEAPF